MPSTLPEPGNRVRTDDLLALLRTIQRRLLIGMGTVLTLGVLVGLLVDGVRGVLGALVAGLLGVVFMAATVASLRMLAGRAFELVQLVLLGGWIVKMVIVLLVMLWLRQQDFYNPVVFFGVLAVVVITAVGIETHAVASARLPYVEQTPAGPRAGQPGRGAGPNERGADDDTAVS